MSETSASPTAESALCEPAAGVERVPGWERFVWLHAGFSTRLGGRSTIYSEDGSARDQNLGWAAKDDPAIVGAARARFVQAIAPGKSAELVTTQQLHSGVVSVIDHDHGPLRLGERTSALRGDGLITPVAGLLLGVITADCVPVLVADIRTHTVAAFHAGWRGTLARIVERGVGTMRSRFGSRPEDLLAAIGPAIGPCCFTVGEEVRSSFASEFAYAEALFAEKTASEGTPNSCPQIQLDLHDANRRQLIDAGLSAEAIQVLGECTACTRKAEGRRKYFSHRAEHGFTGRMLSVIGAFA